MIILLIDILATITEWTILGGCWAVAFPRLFGRFAGLGKKVFFETRWLWPFAAILWNDSVSRILHDDFNWTAYVVILFDTVLWWGFYRIKDDEDRWKRRREKVVEAVSRTGSRLIVVPAN